MKERRGAFGRASGIAESVMAGVKRRQVARAPKVLLYDDAGRPRTLDSNSAPAEALMATARRMVDLVVPDEIDDPLEED